MVLKRSFAQNPVVATSFHLSRPRNSVYSIMSDHGDVIRPFLFAVRLMLWLSAVITMSLTAWVVDHVKGYRAVFTLVIVSI